ncbi:ribonuclease P protein component 4 [Haloarcula nitratireducens]|uniref:Ribonuclease P protein component 4 n=1 Tax=Haloarcula nitratireducens TaxID=2487749 RepID=A0AAW4P9L7_9EURY|nr:ribonuclease P protein component 4 [Halomicroarcula nitratireducens]MBX0294600.1 ribonuclease P [Halomicroarcula nitratireducens]
MPDETTIARERIDRLRAMAREAVGEGREDRAREYVRTARRIAERHRLRLPREFERSICRSCDTFLVPGRNARVRTQSGHVVVTCSCGEHSRYPYR